MTEETNTASVVAELVREHIDAKTLAITAPDFNGEVDVIVRPSELAIESVAKYVDEFRSEPRRRKGVAKFQDLASFTAHATRFKDADSALFANPEPTSPTMTSLLDYHRAGSGGSPRFGEHRGVYAFPLSEEWKAWREKNAKVMLQSEFAEWIENRILDVADPTGAGDNSRAFAETAGAVFASPSRLLELSRGLTMRVGAKIQNVVNLGTGEAQMQFVTEHQDASGAPLKVPSAFLLALPVFQNGAPYEVCARLRYRNKDAAIVWFYELYRPERIFEHAFKEACAQAQSETGLPLFVGSPE